MISFSKWESMSLVLQLLNLVAAINRRTPRLIDMSYVNLVIDTAPVSPRAKLQVNR